MSYNTKIGVYPGTFDPITHGHMDIIERALKIVDHLIVAVAIDSNKSPLFSVEKRLEMLTEEVKNNDRIIVDSFNGLLVNFAKQKGASVIIRGLRAVSDFEYEFQMSCVNSRLNEDIETVFLPASESTHFISSRFVKEIAKLGGEINGFVSENVASNLRLKF